MRDLEAQPCGQASEIDFFDFTDVPSRGGRHDPHDPSAPHGKPTHGHSGRNERESNTPPHKAAGAILRGPIRTLPRTSSNIHRSRRNQDPE